MNIIEYSSTFLLIAFVVYNLSFFGYVLAIAGKRFSNRDPELHVKKWGNRALVLAVVGLICHLLFFFTRWAAAGHIPVSNMFEFMTFLGMMIMVASVIIYLIYRKPVIGVFSMPVGIVVIAYASVFPHEVQPLIPALQSYWLYIHVTTAATGEAFFAVGFAGGLMYLLRTVDYHSSEKGAVLARRSLEMVLWVVLLVVAFACLVFAFKAAGYNAQFTEQVRVVDERGQSFLQERTVEYVLPPIVRPYQSELVHMDPFLGLKAPIFEIPSWMKGVNAGRKLNTVIWSVLVGTLLYGILRLLLRQPIGQFIQPALRNLDPEDLDEISYRAIAIGFPIYTLGALIFAMIWAAEAWGRFWGWDPKEVWALITWLFYSAYLHLRLSRGWHGTRSAWLTVIGFIIVMFTLVGVNLIIAGLHSYAGVD